MPHAIPNPIQQAAAQIVRLINSNPRTPWLGEIEAIVARVVSSPEPASPDPRVAEFQRLARMERGEEAEAALDALQDRINTISLDAWKAGAKTWADVLLFAELARYWAWENEPDGDAAFNEALELSEYCLDGQSTAQLVNAILQMGGRRS